MSSRYTLKSGQINFESNENKGAYACVVIKDGEFFNLTDDLRRMILDALQVNQAPSGRNNTESTDLEDMF